VTKRKKAQPKPKANLHPAVWDFVIADMTERDKTGFKRYGVRLQPHNGRNALQDAYEEALDLAVYLRQRIMEDESQAAAVAVKKPIVAVDRWTPRRKRWAGHGKCKDYSKRPK
jgi:hypothetical protein